MAGTGDRLSINTQQNLLVLLTFNDRAAALIRNAVDVNLFSSQVYRDVVGRAYDYIDQYHKAPADHLPDLLEKDLAKGDANSKMLTDLLAGIGQLRNTVNEKYTLDQLERFVRVQSLKSSVIRASDAIQEEDPDRAEELLLSGLRTRLTLFNSGTRLSEGVSKIYNQPVRRDIINLGIKHLDAARIGPARGEFHLLIAPPKRGKSWWLINAAKHAMLQRMKVVYITLELSEEQILQRLIQSLFSMPRYKVRIPVTRLGTDSLGRLINLRPDTINNRPALLDVVNKPFVEKRIGQLHGRDKNFVVKQFPAGMLSLRGLRNYLEMLERDSGFVPDTVVVDYPDYMEIDPKNYRLESGALYNGLRGVAVERDCHVIVASRSNREGTDAKMVTETHSAEDYSRIYTADTVVTYSQTKAEKALGLARLFVSNTRVADKDGFVVLISQSYDVGQFCLDSAYMTDSYFGHLEQASAQLPPPGEQP